MDHTTTNRSHRSDGCPAPRGHEAWNALKRLAEGRLADDLAILRGLVSANDDHSACDRPQKALVGSGPRRIPGEDGAGDVAEAPFLGEDGGTTDATGTGRQARKKAKKVVKALETV